MGSWDTEGSSGLKYGPDQEEPQGARQEQSGLIVPSGTEHFIPYHTLVASSQGFFLFFSFPVFPHSSEGGMLSKQV